MVVKKKRQSKSKSDKPLQASKLPKSCRYRVLAFQPLSVAVPPQTIELTIQAISCQVAIRPAQSELSLQLRDGGSLLAIEFEAGADEDLFVVGRKGLSMLESFLSALAIVLGSTLQTTELLQIARLSADKKARCEFLIIKELPLRHWGKPVSASDIGKIKHLLAHWDGLEGGHRLRRAALQYREAIGTRDEASAFQEAYMGLEAMEPLLAKAIGLTPGTEEVKGKCGSCGHEFTRKRTALVGVRAFVLGDTDANKADQDRATDWKLINKLRTDLIHGLEDSDELDDRPHKALLAAMHHLHSAICLGSHSKELVTGKYLLARGGEIYLVWGTYSHAKWGPLHEARLAIEISEFSWVPHAEFGLVPQAKFQNRGIKDLELGIAKLKVPLSFATMDEVEGVRTERD